MTVLSFPTTARARRAPSARQYTRREIKELQQLASVGAVGALSDLGLTLDDVKNLRPRPFW